MAVAQAPSSDTKPNAAPQAPDPDAKSNAEDEVYRRAVLARSRNYLLAEALHDEGWVLWLDVDIVKVQLVLQIPLSVRIS